MPEITITARCEPSPEKGKCLLPRSTATVGKPRILVRGNGAAKIMKVGRRADSGPGACVGADALAALGGEDATVNYRAVGVLEAAARDASLRLDAVVAASTLISALLAAWVSFVKNSADEQLSNIASVVAVSAFVAAFAKFWKEYKAL